LDQNRVRVRVRIRIRVQFRVRVGFDLPAGEANGILEGAANFNISA